MRDHARARIASSTGFPLLCRTTFHPQMPPFRLSVLVTFTVFNTGQCIASPFHTSTGKHQGVFGTHGLTLPLVGCRAALLVSGPCIHFSCICACAIAHAHMALVVGAPGIANLFPFGVWPVWDNCRFWCATSYVLAGHAGVVCPFAALRELCVWLPACARAQSRTRGHLPGYFPLFT